MTRDDMQTFWSQNFVPEQRRAGRLGPDHGGRAAAAGREGVRRLAAGHAGAADARRRRRRPRRELVLVDKPGAPQTQLRVAAIGVPRATPDYEALRVMNEALGGLFSSRINLNLREQHGYTYGASSQFVFRRIGRAVPGRVRRAHRRDRRRRSREIFKELQRMRDDDADRRGADAGEGLAGPLAAGGVRDERRASREHGEHLRLRSRPRLLHQAAGARCRR